MLILVVIGRSALLELHSSFERTEGNAHDMTKWTPVMGLEVALLAVLGAGTLSAGYVAWRMSQEFAW